METGKRKREKIDKKRIEDDMRILFNGNLFNLYRACMKNGESLLVTAKLLYKSKKYSDAAFIALTAYEEIGKSQVVADYINRDVSEDEFKNAFKSHEFKHRYNQRYMELIEKKDANNRKSYNATMKYDKDKCKDFKEVRERSLYVEYDKDYQPLSPSDYIEREDAQEMIETVEKEINSIYFAIHLNGRIGSRGLFK